MIRMEKVVISICDWPQEVDIQRLALAAFSERPIRFLLRISFQASRPSFHYSPSTLTVLLH